MSKDKSLFCQFRHDPSTEGYRCIIQLKISTAFEGGLSAGPLADVMNTVDPGFGTKWYKIYTDANKIFREKKQFLDTLRPRSVRGTKKTKPTNLSERRR